MPKPGASSTGYPTATSGGSCSLSKKRRPPRHGSAASPKRSARCMRAESNMCRNIKPLYNFAPPATEDEIHAAALQFVRKVSGFDKPSKANEAAFLAAVDEIAAAAGTLLRSLETNAAPKDRAEEAAKARARSAQRFAR